MPDWIPIVAATLGAIPAAAAFFIAYGRWDGAFQDRTVFLYFIGGMLLGFFVSLLTLFLIAPGAGLIPLILLALLFPISLVLMANRRKWQGQRHAVFNGGAAGLGFAVMMGFATYYYRASQPFRAELGRLTAEWESVKANLTNDTPAPPAPTLDTVAYAFDPVILGQGALLAIGFAGIFFGLGLLAGNAVRLRKQFMLSFLGMAIAFPPVVFLGGVFADETWLWPVLIAAYGLIFGVAAERRILIEGVDEEDRKKRRRRLRKTQQG